MYGTNSGDKNCRTSLRSWETHSRLPVLEYYSGFLLFIVLVAALVALLHVDLLCSSPCVLFIIGVLTYFNMHTVVHYSAYSSVGIRLMVVVHSNDSYTDATPYKVHASTIINNGTVLATGTFDTCTGKVRTGLMDKDLKVASAVESRVERLQLFTPVMSVPRCDQPRPAPCGVWVAPLP